MHRALNCYFFFFFEFLLLFFIYPPSLLCLYRFNAYGVDGGPTAKALRPKFDAFAHQVHSKAGFQLPDIDVSLSVSFIQSFKESMIKTQLNR